MRISGVGTAFLLATLAAALPLASVGAAPGPGSDGPGLVLTQERNNTPLGRYIEHYRDESGKLSFKDVRRLPGGRGGFVRSSRDVPSFRATPDTIWVRFSVRNGLPGARTFYLEYGYPPMDKFWMYSSRRGGGFGPPRIYGDTFKFSKREMKHRHWVFPVHLAAGERRTFYFRFQSQSVMELPFHIWEPKVFQTKDHDEQYILGIYYGIMGVMLLYNLFIYFSARDVTYLYYAGYIVCIATMEMAFNGLAYEYLWPNAAWWNNKVIGLATTLGLVAIVQFSRQLLEVDRKRYPKLNTWADITNAALLMVGIAGLFLPQRPILRVGIPLAISAAALVLTLGIVRLRSGYHPARLFMFAWSFFLIGAILHMLKNAGLFPSMFISSYGIQVGSAIEVVLLSFALADKINVLRGEKEQAQTRYIESQKVAMDNQLRLMNAFYRFVPGEFIKTLEVENIADIKVGAAVLRNMTVLFTDIRNFTGMSAGMSAQENFNFLNSFLKRMEPHIERNNGFVDKFIGDAIMALFSGEAENALRCANEMREELGRYNIYRKGQGFQVINTGIGINTGELILGTVGSVNRIDTTVIGNTVNLAAGLESLTKVFHAGVVVSEYTVQQLQDPSRFFLREIDRVRVKGKSDPVVIYELFDTDPPRIRDKKQKMVPELTAALVFYKMGAFERCLEALKRCAAVFDEDPIVHIYRERCERLMAAPPSEKWDGVTSLTA